MIESFFSSIFSTVSGVFLNMGVLDVIDILIVAFVIYKTIQFISRTRAKQLVKGIGVLIVALLLSDLLSLNTVHFILNNVLTYGIMAIVVIFHPELRRALEYIGRSKLFISRQFADMEKDRAKEIIRQICKAVEYFSSNKVGALIVIEREIALEDIAETGTHVDSEITAMLLDTIFYEGSALHDGAVIIRKDRILAASCMLPLTKNNNLERTLGMRHRAGVGITEVSDAVAIIVSEETGIISMCAEGTLSRFLDVKTVEKQLYNIYLSGGVGDESDSGLLKSFVRRVKNAS